MCDNYSAGTENYLTFYESVSCHIKLLILIH